VGFCSDEGVRRNKGRIGSAAAPEAIRQALGPLAFRLDRDGRNLLRRGRFV
jgi:formiminoglutamase